MYNFVHFLDRSTPKQTRLYETYSTRDRRLYGTLGKCHTHSYAPLHTDLYTNTLKHSNIPQTYIILYEDMVFLVHNGFIRAEGYKRIPFKAHTLLPIQAQTRIPLILHTLTRLGMQPIQGGDAFLRECIAHNAPIYVTTSLTIRE